MFLFCFCHLFKHTRMERWNFGLRPDNYSTDTRSTCAPTGHGSV